jgi:hypothetical protein
MCESSQIHTKHEEHVKMSVVLNLHLPLKSIQRDETYHKIKG